MWEARRTWIRLLKCEMVSIRFRTVVEGCKEPGSIALLACDRRVRWVVGAALSRLLACKPVDTEVFVASCLQRARGSLICSATPWSPKQRMAATPNSVWLILPALFTM